MEYYTPFRQIFDEVSILIPYQYIYKPT
ncbi:hypothetical protein KL86PLE_100358 [uncultured Pleomorphomonas sp.]|uniref:Uncharacterized protein n=1 Tax=uncultured Pleomorphomonas sp. TaxID=442121 RepID=A0A212L2U4_9HYPH|nr:hypothetical protein KL86PLE_100358 [uncultured Pleomorphomonas sp.]